MYDELITKLKGAKKFFPGYLVTAKDFRYELMPQDLCEAADVIEELSMSKDMAFVEEDGRTVIEFVSKWIPVEERLPEKNGDYIVYCIGGNYNQTSCTCLAYWSGKHFYGDNLLSVTHWMPLPMPPESEET